MRDNDDQMNEGLNQIIEIINAKGDTGELNQIVKKSNNDPNQGKGDTKT
ncbi:hypothetical protein HPB58_10995 [Priestia filamentosa]|nr:hypothetical protein [Priestia filamentosa]UOE62656.1 hypothetical protein HPB58_10995 [Priestia filamentosa]